MSRIAVLPSHVADQIAAGEVVERPASVVKELVENALDAGATTIDVTVEDGGRALIRVADDGSGMGPDDAVLALSRHATSKIRDAEDLVGVRSFGFRGEALPAICSVSRLELETSPEDGAGTRVTAHGGILLGTADAARRRGTTVSVAALFYNTPARRKFLRGSRSEWRAIAETLVTMALVRRDVRVTATHDGRNALTLPAASSLRTRIAAVWGHDMADALLEVDHVHGPTRVCGLVERPADVGAGSRRVFLTVNGRAIRDPGLVRAAEAAYRSTVPAGARPSLFLDLTLPADLVDVNVHPAKAEVRFRDRWPVERTLEDAVRRALGTMEAGGAFGVSRWGETPLVLPAAAPAVDVEVLRAPAPSFGALFDAGSSEERPVDGAAGSVAVPTAPGTMGDAQPAAAVAPSEPVPTLWQLRRTWIAFERDDGIVLVDQHSAHERVLYEKFMGVLERGDAPSQRLLLPLTLHLGPAQSEAFEDHRTILETLGYEIEGFGGHTLLVRAVPMPHPRFDAERCLRETLDAITGDRHAAAHTRHERLAATVACKAAIKAGEVLSPPEMRALYVQLRETTLPAHDVHGRSTIVLLGWDELERRFGRR